MWAVMVPYLIKYGLPIAIAILQKTGVISGLEAYGLKAGTHVIQVVKSVKTYSNNDQLNPAASDFPGQIHADGV